MNSVQQNPLEIVVFSLQADEDRRRRLYRLLSDDEKQRAAAFRFDKHRDRFITGRGSIREILADRCNCQPQAIRFELNAYGKPSFDRPKFARQVQFNASSSDAMGAIAICDGMPLGFDMEKTIADARRDYDLIAENEFREDERDWYRRHREGDRISAFFQLWTCKEAYLKALGLGLGAGLDSFSVDLSGQMPRIRDTDLEQDGRSQFHLSQMDIKPEFVACLASPKVCGPVAMSHW